MAIYDYNTNTVSEQLTPPVLRTTKFLAWLKVITSAIQNKWSLIFEDYKTGNLYTDFDILATYNFGDRVLWTNKAVYEATYTDADGVAQSFNGVEPINTLYWTLVNDNCFGIDMRIKMNSQIILLEYYLNHWFFVDSGTDQIYIENNTNVSDVFVMGTSSTYSSTMPKNSTYSETFMGLAPTYPDVSYDFIVWVPSALFTTLGSDYTNRYNSVAQVVDKYKLAGTRYKIDTY
jgi:hypothetical protein